MKLEPQQWPNYCEPLTDYMFARVCVCVSVCNCIAMRLACHIVQTSETQSQARASCAVFVLFPSAPTVVTPFWPSQRKHLTKNVETKKLEWKKKDAQTVGR